MSLLSDLIIVPKPSRDYRLLVWVLTLMACIGMVYLELPVGLIVVFLSVMSYPIWKITIDPKPYPHFQILSFQQGKWTARFQTKIEIYDQMRIAADSGFFLLLHLTCASTTYKRWLVIFLDQLSAQEVQDLNRLDRISPAPKMVYPVMPE